MTPELRRLIDTAKNGRCLLRDKWEEGAALSGREQLKLAKALLGIAPAKVERSGRLVPCEAAFELRPKDRRRLVVALIADGSSDGEILACVPGLAKRTFQRIKADMEPADSGSAEGSGKRRITPKRAGDVGTPGFASFDATSGANPEAHRRLLAALAG